VVNGVGTLNESPLHAALKALYLSPGDMTEQPVGDHIVDIRKPDRVIEVQTVGFGALKAKLPMLLDQVPVTLVYPVATNRTLVKVDGGGVIVSRRLSPRHGSRLDLFSELVAVPRALCHQGLQIDVVLVDDEVTLIPGRSRRRRGWVSRGRRLLRVHETVTYRSVADLLAELPGDLPDPFTTADLAQRLRIPRARSQQLTYCLRHSGALTQAGKQGNAILYRIGAG